MLRQPPTAGFPFPSSETVLALMRNPDYCLYGWAKSKRERCAEDAETAFNNLSLQVCIRGDAVWVGGGLGGGGAYVTMLQARSDAAGDGLKAGPGCACRSSAACWVGARQLLLEMSRLSCLSGLGAHALPFLPSCHRSEPSLRRRRA